MDLDLTTLGAAAFVLTPVIALLLRIFVVPGGTSFDDLIALRFDLEWPQGVQEEDPIPWRTELLTRPDRRPTEPNRRQVAPDLSRAPGP